MKSKKSQDNKKNPALDIHNFYTFSLLVLNEINHVRSEPAEYIRILNDLKKEVMEYKDEKNVLYVKEIPFIYKENLITLIDNAITFLRNQPELEGILLSDTISNTSNDFLNVLKMHDGLQMNELQDPKYYLEKRLNLAGKPLGECYELIDYGMFDPKYIVINWLLSDGDPNRTDRQIIFQPNIKKSGISAGLLPSDRICTIIEFVEDFYESDEQIPYDVALQFNNKYSSNTFSPYSQKTFVNKNFIDDGREKSFNINNKTQFGGIGVVNPLGIMKKPSGEVFKEKRQQFIDNNMNTSSFPYYVGVVPIQGGTIKEEEEGMGEYGYDYNTYNRNTYHTVGGINREGIGYPEYHTGTYTAKPMYSTTTNRKIIGEVAPSEDDPIPNNAYRMDTNIKYIKDVSGEYVKHIKRTIYFNNGEIASNIYKVYE